MRKMYPGFFTQIIFFAVFKNKKMNQKTSQYFQKENSKDLNFQRLKFQMFLNSGLFEFQTFRNLSA